MKKYICALALLVGSASISQAAVTLTGRNFTSTSTGVALVDSSNNLLTVGTTFWTAGSFAGGFDFNVDVASVLAGFTQISSIGGLRTTQPGLFNTGVTYDGGTAATPGVHTGKAVYIVVGNAADIVSSTALAVFNTGFNFIAGDALGNGAFTANAETPGKVVYGILGGAPNTQPGGTFSLTNSLQLTNVVVPEPSVALLGALGGLLVFRRRR